jgi:hypothetical protein
VPPREEGNSLYSCLAVTSARCRNSICNCEPNEGNPAIGNPSLTEFSMSPSRFFFGDRFHRNNERARSDRLDGSMKPFYSSFDSKREIQARHARGKKKHSTFRRYLLLLKDDPYSDFIAAANQETHCHRYRRQSACCTESIIHTWCSWRGGARHARKFSMGLAGQQTGYYGCMSISRTALSFGSMHGRCRK